MAKVIVYHTYYGCDTGCCGHAVEIYDDDVVAKKDFLPEWEDSQGPREFGFDHPRGDANTAARLEWAKSFVREQLGEEHVKDLDWEHCLISDD